MSWGSCEFTYIRDGGIARSLISSRSATRCFAAACPAATAAASTVSTSLHFVQRACALFAVHPRTGQIVCYAGPSFPAPPRGSQYRLAPSSSWRSRSRLIPPRCHALGGFARARVLVGCCATTSSLPPTTVGCSGGLCAGLCADPGNKNHFVDLTEWI